LETENWLRKTFNPWSCTCRTTYKISASFAYITAWRRGAVIFLEGTEVGDNVLRPKNSEARKPETLLLEGEHAEIECQRATMVIESATDVVASLSIFSPRWARHWRFSQSLGETLQECGLTGKLFHDLRPKASRSMIAAGVP